MTEAPYKDARRKLVEGTEVLRTGGGTSLTAGECNAILDHIANLERDNAHAYDAYMANAVGYPGGR